MTIHFISPSWKTYPILIPSLILQTDKDWDLRICNDTPSDQYLQWCASFIDPRIAVSATPERVGHFGHPIRGTLLADIPDDGYICMTNHDNYCCPTLVQELQKQTADFVYWDILHSYTKYQKMNTDLKFAHIDICAAAVRSKIAKAVGWKSMDHAADWLYLQECYQKSRTISKIHRVLAIHN